MSIKRQRGLTIIELVMFMVIMGVAAAGIIGVLNLGTKSSADPLRRKQAMLIAEAYMEEVQLARFTFCVPGDDKELDAKKQSDCGAQVKVGPRAGSMTRPYANVADYATDFDTAQPTFAVNGVDRDVNGRALGQDRNLKTMGNQPLDGITTTVALSLLGASNQLGPAALPIQSSVNNLEALQITVITRYGNGANDFIRLDGYRTRYAPND
ncbi:MSHA pilin protein MshD [Duganella sp. 1411]|uniref:type IV pilus modification PilV family protein n=1 Tax=Duganella sp. 1411 TaxID=2806572 RepID=UPI001AE46D8B|nr:type II secretion system protein [Duganella sp. 1411]MBP1204428.1 MSHA pilin protein MshD [Duganella sp. 1411]